MNTPSPVTVRSADDEAPSLKSFLLQAVLWLPLAFFLWFILRTAVVFPAIRLARLLLLAWFPDLILSASQDFTHLDYSVHVLSHGLAGIQAPALEIDLDADALLYCYNVPVLIGLVMATPLNWSRTFWQIGGGLLLMVPIQAFGLIGEVLKSVSFELGSAVQSGLSGQAGVDPSALGDLGARALLDGRAYLAAHGLTANLLGLWYQFGYLILPSLSPVLIWIVFNRRFIEGLTMRTELGPDGSGQTATSVENRE